MNPAGSEIFDQPPPPPHSLFSLPYTTASLPRSPGSAYTSTVTVYSLGVPIPPETPTLVRVNPRFHHPLPAGYVSLLRITRTVRRTRSRTRRSVSLTTLTSPPTHTSPTDLLIRFEIKHIIGQVVRYQIQVLRFSDPPDASFETLETLNQLFSSSSLRPSIYEQKTMRRIGEMVQEEITLFRNRRDKSTNRLAIDEEEEEEEEEDDLKGLSGFVLFGLDDPVVVHQLCENCSAELENDTDTDTDNDDIVTPEKEEEKEDEEESLWELSGMSQGDFSLWARDRQYHYEILDSETKTLSIAKTIQSRRQRNLLRPLPQSLISSPLPPLPLPQSQSQSQSHPLSPSLTHPSLLLQRRTRKRKREEGGEEEEERDRLLMPSPKRRRKTKRRIRESRSESRSESATASELITKIFVPATPKEKFPKEEEEEEEEERSIPTQPQFSQQLLPLPPPPPPPPPALVTPVMVMNSAPEMVFTTPVYSLPNRPIRMIQDTDLMDVDNEQEEEEEEVDLDADGDVKIDDDDDDDYPTSRTSTTSIDFATTPPGEAEVIDLDFPFETNYHPYFNREEMLDDSTDGITEVSSSRRVLLQCLLSVRRDDYSSRYSNDDIIDVSWSSSYPAFAVLFPEAFYVLFLRGLEWHLVNEYYVNDDDEEEESMSSSQQDRDRDRDRDVRMRDGDVDDDDDDETSMDGFDAVTFERLIWAPDGRHFAVVERHGLVSSSSSLSSSFGSPTPSSTSEPMVSCRKIRYLSLNVPPQSATSNVSSPMPMSPSSSLPSSPVSIIDRDAPRSEEDKGGEVMDVDEEEEGDAVTLQSTELIVNLFFIDKSNLSQSNERILLVVLRDGSIELFRFRDRWLCLKQSVYRSLRPYDDDGENKDDDDDDDEMDLFAEDRKSRNITIVTAAAYHEPHLLLCSTVFHHPSSSSAATPTTPKNRQLDFWNLENEQFVAPTCRFPRSWNELTISQLYPILIRSIDGGFLFAAISKDQRLYFGVAHPGTVNFKLQSFGLVPTSLCTSFESRHQKLWLVGHADGVVSAVIGGNKTGVLKDLMMNAVLRSIRGDEDGGGLRANSVEVVSTDCHVMYPMLVCASRSQIAIYVQK